MGYAQNKAALVQYWRDGAKSGPSAIGIELEHTLVRGPQRQAVSYSEPQGVQWVLEQLLATFPHATYDAAGDLLGVSRIHRGRLEAVTLEPAAQLELSAGPFTSLTDAESCFAAFEELLVKITAPVGIEVVLQGYHPTAQARELELIPKLRYECMDRHFASIGPWGVRMMRGSASTQISIDYTDEADCLRKLRLGCIGAPLFALMCDNAPVLEGAPAPCHLVRTRIWRQCDPARCGTIPGILSPDFTLEDYAEFVLGMPAILVPDGASWRPTSAPFREIYADAVMSRAELEHALSMGFTDVRLKTYIELRPADAMPLPFVLAYAALVKGLFASQETLALMEGLFEGVDECALEEAKINLEEKGYDAQVYGRSAASLAESLINIALVGLSDEESAFLLPLEDLVEKRTTLARAL